MGTWAWGTAPSNRRAPLSGPNSETSAFWLVCAGPVLTPGNLGSGRQGGGLSGAAHACCVQALGWSRPQRGT